MTKNEELRKVQLTELETLKKIDEVCKKNKINYFLIGGTLLGAARHKGFIPWDDDIDLMMFREDYDKFIKEFSKNNNGEYFIQSYETENIEDENFSSDAISSENQLYEEKK